MKGGDACDLGDRNPTGREDRCGTSLLLIQSAYQGRPTPDDLLAKRGPEVFADPDKMDEVIAANPLADAYTAKPFDTDAFKKEFSDAEAGKAFNALFGGSTASV